MTSCGGTSMVTVRSGTLTILSMIGMRKMRPGPLAPITRPRRKITPRSYSRSTLIADVRRRNPRKMSASTEYANIQRLPSLGPSHSQSHAIHLIDHDRRALFDRLLRSRVPILSVHEHRSGRLELGERRPALAQE